MRNEITRRIFLASAFAVGVTSVLGCRTDRNFTLFGYTTEPQFDPNIRSVYIPTFKLNTFIANPHRGIDVDVTEAVVRELAARRSPMRIVSDPARADTELIGTIVAVNKGVLNRNPQNLIREAEISISVDVVWRDLRTSEILTNRKAPERPPAAEAFDPSVEKGPPVQADPKPLPVRVTAVGRVLPELGESTATGDQMATKRLAKQIVNMMERNWELPPK